MAVSSVDNSSAEYVTIFSSSLLRAVFEEAHNSKRFRVIVADGRPRMEGREMVRNLINAGIQCSYTLVSAVPYFMPEVRGYTWFGCIYSAGD